MREHVSTTTHEHCLTQVSDCHAYLRKSAIQSSMWISTGFGHGYGPHDTLSCPMILQSGRSGDSYNQETASSHWVPSLPQLSVLDSLSFGPRLCRLNRGNPQLILSFLEKLMIARKCRSCWFASAESFGGCRSGFNCSKWLHKHCRITINDNAMHFGDLRPRQAHSSAAAHSSSKPLASAWRRCTYRQTGPEPQWHGRPAPQTHWVYGLLSLLYYIGVRIVP